LYIIRYLTSRSFRRRPSGSGVTRVGVTRGGNWGCHPYFSWKKISTFLVIIISHLCSVTPAYFLRENWRHFANHCHFYWFHSGVTPLDGVTPHLFTRPTSFVHYSLLIRPHKMFFALVSLTGGCHPGAPWWRHFPANQLTTDWPVQKLVFPTDRLASLAGTSKLNLTLIRPTTQVATRSSNTRNKNTGIKRIRCYLTDAQMTYDPKTQRLRRLMELKPALQVLYAIRPGNIGL